MRRLNVAPATEYDQWAPILRTRFQKRLRVRGESATVRLFHPHHRPRPRLFRQTLLGGFDEKNSGSALSSLSNVAHVSTQVERKWPKNHDRPVAVGIFILPLRTVSSAGATSRAVIISAMTRSAKIGSVRSSFSWGISTTGANRAREPSPTE